MADDTTSVTAAANPMTVSTGADRYELRRISLVMADAWRVDYSPDGPATATWVSRHSTLRAIGAPSSVRPRSIE